MELNHSDIEKLAELVALKVANQVDRPHGKWLTLHEAMVYARVDSINTLKKWVREGKIYGMRRSGKGNWIIDRESIDDFYNGERIT